MDNQKVFKMSLYGFKKHDVMDYIYQQDQAHSNQIKDLERQLNAQDSTSDRLLELETVINLQLAEKAEHISTVDLLKEEVREHKMTNSTMVKEIEQLRAQLSEAKNAQTNFGKELSQLTNQKNDISNQKSELATKLNSLNTKLSQLSEKNQELKDLNRDLVSENKDLTKQLAQRDNRLSEIAEDLQRRSTEDQ